MTFLKRIFGGLTLRCCGAIATGLAIVTIITMGLMVISDKDEPSSKMAAYTIRFPEDEQMLQDLSAQITKEAEAHSLSDIQPASGDAVKSAK